MVFFSCNSCNASLKRNQIEKHRNGCRGQSVSCIDCGNDYWGNDFNQHTKCISEDQKYGGKNYQPKANANKGERKQEEWLEVVQQAINQGNHDHKLRNVLEKIKDYPNIPRKKAKFENFLKNSVKIWDTYLATQAWDVISAQLDKVKQANQAAVQQAEEKKKEEASKENTNSEDTAESTEEETKKKSKREKKEERRTKQHKEEKKNRKKSEDTEEVEMKKKKSKKRKREEDENEEIVHEIVSEKKKKKKKNKKMTHDDEESSPKKMKIENGEGRLNDTLVEDENQPKFSWESAILSVLKKSDGEVSLKKLRKKVLAAYHSSSDENGKTDEQLFSKLNKKINKNPSIKLHKERVTLLDS